ncbi:uncharacterized protein LALA0_S09e05820g [Lachancea lanzarotensis]|uniref:LALA0S09e05820g1_1 n=1 Tax=Lachancea lanzarotensis TaxID=1245769 RepID=A0A0C7MVF1_9SACH|nr:uncharacterized protein LALA0_S09e05820g [Lachancea lanzarotensis]CEP63936.1 LALA0S09e05820g1_1 [Lachancea lanzarotensis]
MPDTTNFLGGFVAGTKFMMANGEPRAIENVLVGDKLMKDDGTAVEIIAVPCQVTDTVKIRQTSKHTAHLRDSNRKPPWGLLDFTCAWRQSLNFGTYQVKKDSFRSNGKRVISIHQMAVARTKDGREIALVKNRDKLFRHHGDEYAANKYIAETMAPYPDQLIFWDCEVGDLEYLTSAPRTSTCLSYYPLYFENHVLQSWLEKHFDRAVTQKALEGMAWLLGFWVGDGHRRGPMFALHSGDHDVNGRLKRNAELWGMDLIIKKEGPSDGYKAIGYLHTYSGTLRNLYHKSPICEVLSGLGFWENGRRGAAKRVPKFLSTDQRIVREAFLAGLIDSDGCTRIQDNLIRIKIVTVLPSVRDAIYAIARSLGLNVTVFFYHERMHKLGYHESDAWTFNLFKGTNLDTLQSILSRCSCERKRNPPIQLAKTRDVEEFEDQEDEEDQRSSIRKEMLAEEDSNDSDDSCYLSDDEETAVFEIDTTDTYFEKHQGLTGEDIILNPNRVTFTMEPNGKQEVFGLVCSDDCNLLTSDQVAVGSSKLIGENDSDQVNAVTGCISCKSTRTPEWYRLPWDKLTYHRICKPCARSFRSLLLKCYKSDCNHILKQAQLTSFRRSRIAKVRKQIAGSQITEGYPCTKCRDGIYVKMGDDDDD